MRIQSVLIVIFLALALMGVFLVISKQEKWENLKSSTFECGFTCYFGSRFSFSVHYYTVGLIFLFLDLELCMMMPLMSETVTSLKMGNMLMTFVLSLLAGLLVEWKEGKLEWKY